MRARAHTAHTLRGSLPRPAAGAAGDRHLPALAGHALPLAPVRCSRYALSCTLHSRLPLPPPARQLAACRGGLAQPQLSRAYAPMLHTLGMQDRPEECLAGSYGPGWPQLPVASRQRHTGHAPGQHGQPASQPGSSARPRARAGAVNAGRHSLMATTAPRLHDRPWPTAGHAPRQQPKQQSHASRLDGPWAASLACRMCRIRAAAAPRARAVRTAAAAAATCARRAAPRPAHSLTVTSDGL